jgi:AAA domain (dynein-related subfamily)
MSDPKSLGQQEAFTSKLDIVMVSTKRLRKMIDIAAHTPKAYICAVGKSGIGKTAIPMQAAADRGAPYAALYLPTTSIEEFSIPTMAIDSRQYYDKRIPRFFQPLFNFVEENKGKIKPGQGPILVFEEINRAKDKNVTNACFTIIETRRIGDTPIPDEIQIVVTMNPTGGGMTVNEFERDPAYRRRLNFVGVTASFGEFMQYARSAKFHKHVLDHLAAQPLWFYNDVAAAAGKVFPCPAAWETVSGLCKALEACKVSCTGPEAKALFAGKIGLAATEAFLDFISNNSVVITPDEVLKSYKDQSVVRDRLLNHVQQGNQPKMTELVRNIAEVLMDGSERAPKSFLAQLALFMSDLPADISKAFIHQLGVAAKSMDGGDAYLTKITMALNNDPQFAAAMATLRDKDDEIQKAIEGKN